MSLLMEALRKAEEAKRQAAQKEKDEPGSEAPARASEPSPMEDPVALEAQMDVLSADRDASEPDVLLDAPFEFHIDESFGTLDLKAAPQAALSPEPEPAPEPEPEPEPASEPEPELEPESPAALAPAVEDLSDVLALDPEIEYLRPEDLRQFKPAVEPAPVPSAPAAGFTLTLEDAPAREETPRAAFIADPEALSTEPVPTPAVVETPPPVAAAPAPLRASRVDDAQEPEALPEQKPERPRFKVPGIKATEENRKRESARAVFNAKTGQEPKSRNTRRLIVIAAVLALIPLAGGGFLLVQELGLLGGGTQYNIPAASYDAVREFPVVEELAVPAVTDIQLADVTQDPVVVPLQEPVPDTLMPAPVATLTEPLTVTEEIVAVPVDSALPATDVSVSADVAPVPEAVAERVAPAAEPQTATPDTDTASIAEVVMPADAMPAVQEPPVQEAPSPVSGTPPPSPINITRSSAAPQVNAQLTQAYAAFRDQDYYAARALYQQALRELPNNRDALLGLAATAIQLGDVTGARATYSKLLELDPRDALARVGLLDSMPLGDAVQTESQLQSLKAEHPELAQLSFALGNFYASQRRWNEAQAAYYDALLAAKAESGSAVSPDFAFNLAVSLERLNQAQPAFNFYREALEQSRLVNPGFDVRVLRERLDALQRVLP